MYLFPKVTQRGEKLTMLDIAVRRPDVAIDPTEVVGIYIQDGIAKYATSEVTDRSVTPADWVEVRALDFAKDVSIAFDGSWQKLPDGKARFYSIGSPWIFIVAPDGLLYAMSGDTGAPYTLVPSGVVKVDSIRGWKDVQTSDEDQGLIVAYLKTDGLAYYRAYVKNAEDVMAWSLELLIPSQPADTVFTDIKLFRTNDYRVGFILSDGLLLTMLLTERTWAGMAVEPGEIGLRAESISVTLTPIQYTDITYEDIDQVALAAHSMESSLLYASENFSFYSLSNPDAFTVFAYTNHRLISADFADFTFVDSEGRSFRVFSATEVNGSDGTDAPIQYILEIEDFNDAEGTVTIAFLGTGTTRGQAGQVIPAFQETFIPIGLVPTLRLPPVPVTIINVEG